MNESNKTLAAKAEAPAPRTELSKRIRAAATADVTLAQAKLLIGAAEEIERAQQAAAPGAKEARPHKIAELLRIYDEQGGDWCKIARAVESRYVDAHSAPGTPEAPAYANALRYIGWRDAVLSEDRDFVCAIENGLPTDVLERENDRAPTASEWDDAIDYAMALKRAAQLDGGQGDGGDKNAK